VKSISQIKRKEAEKEEAKVEEEAAEEEVAEEEEDSALDRPKKPTSLRDARE